MEVNEELKLLWKFKKIREVGVDVNEEVKFL